MKKTLLISFAAALLLGSTNNCLAGPYFSGNLAAVIGHDSDWTEPGFSAEVSSDTGYGVSLAIGNDLMDYRLDLEVAYRANDLDDITVQGLPAVPIEGEVTSTSLLANAYIDFHNNSAVTPYIGFGVGGANVDVEVDNILGVPVGESEDDNVFAYQLAVGSTFKVSETSMIDLSYRYFATDDPDLNGTEIEYATSNITLGFRMNF
jgi:opacity protein-like surface antigen